MKGSFSGKLNGFIDQKSYNQSLRQMLKPYCLSDCKHFLPAPSAQSLCLITFIPWKPQNDNYRTGGEQNTFLKTVTNVSP